MRSSSDPLMWSALDEKLRRAEKLYIARQKKELRESRQAQQTKRKCQNPCKGRRRQNTRKLATQSIIFSSAWRIFEVAKKEVETQPSKSHSQEYVPSNRLRVQSVIFQSNPTPRYQKVSEQQLIAWLREGVTSSTELPFRTWFEKEFDRQMQENMLTAGQSIALREYFRQCGEDKISFREDLFAGLWKVFEADVLVSGGHKEIYENEAKFFQAFLDILFERRAYLVTEFVKQQYGPTLEPGVIQIIIRETEYLRQQSKDLCLKRCANCEWLCLLPSNHNYQHDCRDSHDHMIDVHLQDIDRTCVHTVPMTMPIGDLLRGYREDIHRNLWKFIVRKDGSRVLDFSAPISQTRCAQVILSCTAVPVAIRDWTPQRQISQAAQAIAVSKASRSIRKQFASSDCQAFLSKAKTLKSMTGKPQIVPPSHLPDEKNDAEVKEAVFTMGLDVDYDTFGPQDAARVLEIFSKASGVPVEHLRLGTVSAGSVLADIIVWVQEKHQQVRKTIEVIYENMTRPQALKVLNTVKTFMVMCGLPKETPAGAAVRAMQEKIQLHAKWNRMYGPNGTNWDGFLQDGRNRGGKDYFCPKGWKRFSIKLPHATQDQFNAKYGSWAIGYHGTKFQVGASILFAGFIPAIINAGRDEGRGLYTTPSIIYAAHPRYAEVKEIPSEYRSQFANGKYIQFVLECRVDPNSIEKVYHETLGAGGYIIDRNIPNGVIEWLIESRSFYGFADPRSPVVCSGIMVRVTDEHPQFLVESNWWGTLEVRNVRILSHQLA